MWTSKMDNLDPKLKMIQSWLNQGARFAAGSILVSLTAFLFTFSNQIEATEGGAGAAAPPTNCPELAQASLNACKGMVAKLESLQAMIGMSALGQIASSITSDAAQLEAAADNAIRSARAAQADCGLRQTACNRGCSGYIDEIGDALSGETDETRRAQLRQELTKAVAAKRDTCEIALSAELASAEAAAAQAMNAKTRAGETKWAARGLGVVAGVGVLCATGIGICKDKKKKKDPADPAAGDEDESDDQAGGNNEGGDGDGSGGNGDGSGADGGGAGGGTDGDGTVADNDVNCSDEANRAHPTCAAPLERNCQANPNGEDCREFTEEYCRSTSTAETPPPNQGAGIGSQYCQHVSAFNFCSQPGRGGCLSCFSLGRMSSAQCLANPMVCLPQVTRADLDRIQASAACGSDPIYSNPAFIQSQQRTETESEQGAASAESNVAGGSAGGALPTGSNSLIGGSAQLTGSQSATRGNVSSLGERAQSLVPDHVGVRTQAPDASVYRVGGSGATGGTGGGSTGLSTGSLTTGSMVTAGVAPSLGPSLFARASQIVQSECASGSNNNCGPRRAISSDPAFSSESSTGLSASQ